MIEKILERLESSYHVNFNFHIRNDYRKVIDGIYDEVFKIVQEVAKEYGNGWIPVETELPKKHGKYIVTVENLTGRDVLPERVFECAYAYGQFIFDGSYDNNVTAWRRKPAPYQKGE